MKSKHVAAIVLFSVLIAFGARLSGLGDFMTVDEQNWMIRSSHFYQNIFVNGDTGGAFQTTHPGATAMWIIGAGEVIQEARLGFAVDESTLSHFRFAATLPIAITTSLLVGLAVFFIARLWGVMPAVGSGLLLALDPYLTGMSQIAHLDSLLALLVLNAILAFFLNKRVIAGICMGLAIGAKALPALPVFAFFALILVVRHGKSWRADWKYVVSTLGLMFGVAMLTFYVVWPALWFTDDIGRSYVKDVPTILEDSHIETELSSEPISPASFYARSLLGRTTPFALIVVIGFAVVSVGASLKRRSIPLQLWLLLFSIAYLVLISFAAKKADRYALVAFLPLIVTAGYGAVLATRVLQKRWPRIRIGLSLGVIGVLYGAQLLIWTPYSIAYNNLFLPDIRPRPQQGWGEGLDAAAAYLNKSPFIDRLSIASWYPSVTSTYFDGKTFSLSSRDDHRVGYVVLYRNMEGRAEDDIASNVLDEFADKEPEHVIEIGGIPYAWIYNTLGPYYFRQNVGEITQGVEVGQTLTVPSDTWGEIGISFATFGRTNTSTITMEIKEHPDGEVIRSVEIPAAEVLDQDWYQIPFEEISDTAGKDYYVGFTSDAVAGNGVTIRYLSQDVLPGEVFINDRFREGDIGYRF